MKAKTPVTFRLDDISISLLSEMVEKITAEGVDTNKTDVVQKAIYMFGKSVLDSETIEKIVSRHRGGFF